MYIIIQRKNKNMLLRNDPEPDSLSVPLQIRNSPDGRLSHGARAFLASARACSPFALGEVFVSLDVLQELEAAHRSLIAMHLEKDLKSARVLREMRR